MPKLRSLFYGYTERFTPRFPSGFFILLYLNVLLQIRKRLQSLINHTQLKNYLGPEVIYRLIPYFIPRQRRVWIIYRNIINEYLKYEYSLIPIDSEKKPYIYWKPFQYKKAITEDVFDWYNIFCDVNIGIVTGNISKLTVVDVDDLNLFP